VPAVRSVLHKVSLDRQSAFLRFSLDNIPGGIQQQFRVTWRDVVNRSDRALSKRGNSGDAVSSAAIADCSPFIRSIVECIESRSRTICGLAHVPRALVKNAHAAALNDSGLLIHVGGFNLGLVRRQLIGIGKPRRLLPLSAMISVLIMSVCSFVMAIRST
jgi:hypothetical protein